MGVIPEPLVTLALSGSPFPSTLAAEAFVFAMAVWIASEIVGGAIVPALRRGGRRVQRRNLGSNTLVLLSWIFMFVVAGSFAADNIAMLPAWVSYLGAAVVILGVAIRQWAIAVLGRFFSGVIGVQTGQNVVESGPYKLVRHPSYTGVLVLELGIGLALRSLAAIPVIVLLFALAYGYRMLVEEKVLASELGDSYRAYMKRTKRVIPFVV